MYLEPQEMKGACPGCGQALGTVPVTAGNTAFTAPALAMLRGYGHLVVLAGTSWQVRCVRDRLPTLHPAPGVSPAALPASRPVVPASAATQRQGARR